MTLDTQRKIPPTEHPTRRIDRARSWALLTGIVLVLAALFSPCRSVQAADAVLDAAAGLYEGIRTETLPNGLRVYLKPVPNSPVVTTMVAYKVGSADEDLDHTGLSHYLEHLMFKGTDKIMPGDIDRLTLRNGGANNAFCHQTCCGRLVQPATSTPMTTISTPRAMPTTAPSSRSRKPSPIARTIRYRSHPSNAPASSTAIMIRTNAAM